MTHEAAAEAEGQLIMEVSAIGDARAGSTKPVAAGVGEGAGVAQSYITFEGKGTHPACRPRRASACYE